MSSMGQRTVKGNGINELEVPVGLEDCWGQGTQE